MFKQLNKQTQLSLAISIAVDAHASRITESENGYSIEEGQFDKGGNPYILHPLHLMHKLLSDPQLATIAVLHDVIEDCEKYDIQMLKELGFSGRVTTALELLTHEDEDDYLKDYIVKISSNYDAIIVKQLDLEHNSCITRLKNKIVTERDMMRLEKYHTAFLFLTEAKDNFK